MRKLRVLYLCVLLILALACVLPGGSATTPSAVNPTADVRLPLMVAETVVAAMTQTALAVPPTPEPTFTPIPTTEPTIMPTAQIAFSSLTMQEDGAVLFRDEGAGFSVLIPAGWMAVRLYEPEFLEAMSLTQTADPLLYAALDSIRNSDPNDLRLFVLNIENEILEGEPVTSMRFHWAARENIPLDSVGDLKAIAEEWARSVAGLEITSMNIFTTPSNMTFGIIESEGNDEGGILSFYKRVYFNAKHGLVRVELITSERLKLDLIPAFDAIMDTIQFTAQ